MRNLALILGAALCLLAGCSLNDGSISGASGGSETTNGITARVVRPDNAPAVNAAVRLRRSDYVANLPALGKTDIYGADAVTDSQGRFSITGLDSGAYTIEVSDGNATALLLTCALTHGDTVDFGVAALQPFAVLRGTLDSAGRGGARLFVQVRGLERITETGADGVFGFSDLPSGVFGLRICALDPAAYVAKTIYGIPALSADTARVGLALPAPWREAAINETPSGSVAIVNNTFAVSGGGPDIWDTADGFHFIYQAWRGDVTMTARVNRLDSTDVNAKACLMVRASLAASSFFAAEEMEPGGWSFLQWRNALSDTTPYIAQGVPFPFPHWLKLERRGDTLSGSHSEDGINWIQRESAVVVMPADVFVGLAVTSHRLNQICTAYFDNVQISP